ncbi:hypothetical protein CNR22_18580 [Sphingobacteriaceae bacterium]|nr:hypothetical protein CNR22_18580 [Sphingobacteriaceae bacterium]
MKTFVFLFFTALLQYTAIAQNGTTSASAQYPVGMTVDQFNLKLKTSTKPLFVNFTADWCVVCKRQKPILDQVMLDTGNKVDFLIIDMENNPAIADYFEVDGLPVIILYINGSMIWNRVGLQDRTQLLNQVGTYILQNTTQSPH